MSQSSTPPPAAIRPVPIGATMRAAYGAVFGSLGLLLKAAALPFLLSIVVLFLAGMAGESAVLSFVLTVVGFVPYTLFGVAWHRLTLLGPARGAPVVFPSWRQRHFRFLGYVVAITGLFYLVAALMVGLGFADQGTVIEGSRIMMIAVATLVGIVALPYLLVRLAFVFPAVAVDEAYTLRESWAHTRGQGFRLLATLILTALPMLFVIWLVGATLGILVLPEIAVEGGAGAESGAASAEQALRETLSENAATFALAQLVLAVLNYIVMALMVSAISIAFQICTGWVPAPAGGPPTRTGNGGEGDGP